MSLNLKTYKKPRKKVVNTTIDYWHDFYIKKYNRKEQVILELKTCKNTKTREKLLKEIETLPEDTISDYLVKVFTVLHKYNDLNEKKFLIDPKKNPNIQIKDFSTSQKLLESEYLTICGIPHNTSQLSRFNTSSTICRGCESKEIIENVGFYTCNACGLTTNDTPITGISFSQIQETEVSQKFIYKRTNYFNEWLRQLTGSENAEIPETLLDNIKRELTKRNINQSSGLKPSILKQILKDLKSSKYYENIQLIISLITKKPILSISAEENKKCNDMFNRIQIPYEKFKGNRTNSLSYSYVLYKFFELLNLKDYLCHIQLLKNRDNILKHDILWKKIIHEIQKEEGDSLWVYIPTC